MDLGRLNDVRIPVFLGALLPMCFGCYQFHTLDDEPEVVCEPPDELELVGVDLLFVIDNSGSMMEEQVSLAEQVPRLVTALVTGDSNGDGAEDFPPVESLQVGVVTTDLGTGGHALPGCSGDLREGGPLLTMNAVGAADCSITHPPVLDFETGDDPAELSRAVGCATNVGVGGCGVEQPLEAAILGLVDRTPDRVYPPFPRADSTVVVVLLTDEDDCSIAEPDLFEPWSTVYTGDADSRCLRHPEALRPPRWYVTAMEVLVDDPRRLVFAAIAGIPPDLVSVDYEQVLEDARMQLFSSTSSEMPFYTPSCRVPGRGIAYPPRRIVEVAAGLEERGATTTVQSICDADFAPLANAIVERIGSTVGRCRDALPSDVR